MTPPDPEAVHWLAWSRLPGIAPRHLHGLARAFGCLEVAWRAPRAALEGALGGPLAAEAGRQRHTRSPLAAWQDVQRPGMRIMTWVDDDFPALLRAIPDPPGVIYMRGECPPLDHAIAIVGSRRPSAYGEGVARRLAGSLAGMGATIVSGAAMGIDAAAHEGALSAQAGRTVAVLGCGLDHVYPRWHRRLYMAIADQGALITEYAPDTAPQKWHFPQRNRLIAGLSQGVIVVEAQFKSGSLITADQALDQGRQVFAVPGPVDARGSEGPHALIKAGARLVAGADDVLEELGWTLAAAPVRACDTPREQALWDQLAAGPAHADTLAAGAGLSAAEAGGLLIMMTLKSLVRPLPGQRYERA